MDKHISLAWELGYEGQELRDYLKRQQDLEREERLAQREYEREKKEVRVLRDTGCSGVVVRRDLVSDEQMLGKELDVTLINESKLKYPVARISVECPFLMALQKPYAWRILCMI